jgi:hypothetical protein
MDFIFGKIDILAVLVFIFATLFVTEGLKNILRKYPRVCALLDVGFYKLCLSWLVGAVVFFALAKTLHTFPVTEATIMQFAVWIALLNGGYKIVTTLLDHIKEMKSKA